MFARNYRRCIAGLLVIPMTALGGGCSLFAKPVQTIQVNAADPRTQIIFENELVGTGTATLSLRRNRNHTIIGRFPDGTERRVRLNPQISTTGIFDIVGGILFLVPFIGAASPGFWVLQPDTITFGTPVPPAVPSHPPVDYGPATEDETLRMSAHVD